MRTRSQLKFAFDKLPPELRVHIHSFLKDDRRTLFNAIRVNKSWFHQLIGFLWSEPILGALLYPSKRGRRRQFYAEKIRTLVLDCELAGYGGNSSPSSRHSRDALFECEMPYLENVWIEGNLTPPDELLCKLLRPSLLSVKLPPELSESVIESLGRCPRLTHLVARKTMRILNPESFLNLLTRLPHLSSIELDGEIFATLSWPPNVRVHTNRIVAYLLKHGRLKQLKLGKTMYDNDVQEISDLVGEIVPGSWNLSSLSICGHYDALSYFLINTCKSLKTLEIEATLLGSHEPSDHDLCEYISRFFNLTKLCLDMWSEQILRHDDFVALGRLSRLEVLKIISYWPEDLSESDETNDRFCTWILNFAELRELELSFEGCRLGVPAIAAIGQSCPHLEQCTIGWAQDLSTWASLVDHEPVLFPKLKKLSLLSVDEQFQHSPNIVPWEPEWEQEEIREGLTQLKTILKLAPRLTCIRFIESEEWVDTSILQIGLESLTESDDLFVWNLDEDIIAKIKEEDGHEDEAPG